MLLLQASREGDSLSLGVPGSGAVVGGLSLSRVTVKSQFAFEATLGGGGEARILVTAVLYFKMATKECCNSSGVLQSKNTWSASS